MRPALPQPCLCLVTDRRVGDPAALIDRVAAAVAGGVNMAQLREKDLPGGKLLALAQELKNATAGQALLLVNERVDVAAIAGADGAQLGEEALPVAAARRLLGPGPLLGRSVHSEEGAARACAEGADFLLVGAMFATRSHPGEEPAGPELIARIADRRSVPIIGIGGITPLNLGAVIRAGACGVAVITGILAASDPQKASRDYMTALQTAWAEAPQARAEAKTR